MHVLRRFTLFRSWEGDKNFSVGIFLNKNLLGYCFLGLTQNLVCIAMDLEVSDKSVNLQNLPGFGKKVTLVPYMV